MLRRLAWFAAVALIAAPSFGFAQEKAAAKPGPKIVQIINVDTGKLLSIADSSMDDEAAAVLVKVEAPKEGKDAAQEKKTKATQWKLDKDGEHWKITNRNSGKVLDVSGFSADEGTVIIQYGEKSEENDNQRWSWIELKKTDDAAKPADSAKAGDAAKEGEKPMEGRIKSKSSSLVLDADQDGIIVQRSASDKAKSQVWRIVEVKEYDSQAAK